MKKLLVLFALIALNLSPLHAQEADHRPDDRVMFDVSVEDWVSTKTARVTAVVEAAVSAVNAGGMRTEMTKTVHGLANAEWRITSFDRSQDQAGMERWGAVYEARLQEVDLTGLADTAKKLSKPGLQITVGAIDFSPTLEETEAMRAGLRAQVYKIANEQLASLNGAMPGRNYRIALVNFTGEDEAVPMPRVIKGRVMAMSAVTPAAASMPQGSNNTSMERAEKVTLSARIIYATPVSGDKPPAPPPPAEIKH